MQPRSEGFPKTAIITICWNSTDRVNIFLSNLGTVTLPNTDVVVIDNNAKTRFKPKKGPDNLKFKIIHMNDNIGFAGGCNVGIRYAIENSYDYVWLLNNDIEIEPDCLEELIATAEGDVSIGALSPAIFDLEEKSKLQFLGATPAANCLDIHYLKSDDKQLTTDKLLLWGTTMLIRCSVFKSVGMLREDYFAYWEDFEFSTRLLNAGYKTKVVTSALCFHQWSDDSHISRRAPYFYYYMTRNAYYFWKDLSYSIIGRRALNRIFLSRVLESISGRLTVGDMEAATAIVQGYIDAHQEVKGIYKPRSMRILRRLFFLAPYLLSRVLKGDYSYIFRRFQ